MKIKLLVIGIALINLACLNYQCIAGIWQSAMSAPEVMGAFEWSDVGPEPLGLSSGYIGDVGSINLDLQYDGNGNPDVRSLSLDVPVSGMELGCLAPIGLGEMGKLTLSTSFVAPTAGNAMENLTGGGVTGAGEFNWDSTFSKSTYEALWEIPVRDSVYALLGFRYESLDISLSNPSGGASLLQAAQAQTSADFYIPMVGLMMDLGNTSFGFTVLPVAPGTLNHGETLPSGNRLDTVCSFAGGHWAQAWFEHSPVSFKLGPIATGIGLFANFTSAGGSCAPRVEIGSASGVEEFSQYDLSFNRRLFTIGAKATIGLDNPF